MLSSEFFQSQCETACVFLTQDSIDLFLGNYAVEEGDWMTQLRDPKDWKFLTVRTHQLDQSKMFPQLFLSVDDFSLSFSVADHHGGGVLHVHHLSAHGW